MCLITLIEDSDDGSEDDNDDDDSSDDDDNGSRVENATTGKEVTLAQEK